MFRRTFLIVAVLALSLVVAGCSGSDDGDEDGAASTAPTTDTGSAEPGDGSEPSMVISIGSETVSIGGGELPEGWPEGFPDEGLPANGWTSDVSEGLEGDFAFWVALTAG